MSILGFGRAPGQGADQDVGKTSGPSQYGGLGHQTEELRDERINQDLNQAYSLKHAKDFNGALELYLKVLSQDFIKNSQLEQHIHMKLNAHKNVAEIYESIENFNLAKTHYTSALRIKENDSWTWTKVARIEYECFQNFELAKKCYEAAINTKPALQKRSAAICPILVKLAEISFKLSDFEQSEKHVDAILSRSHAPNMDPNSKVFAMKMKAFFLSLNGDESKKSDFLRELRTLTNDPEASYHDLDIIKAFYARTEHSFSKPTLPMFKAEDNSFVYLKNQLERVEIDDQMIWVKLEVTETGELSQLYSQFLSKLADELSSHRDKSGAKIRIDCNSFVGAGQSLIDKHTDPLTQQLSFSQNLNPVSAAEEQPLPEEEKQGSRQPSNKEAATKSLQNEKRRAPKRKMDFTESQLAQINLKTLESYKEYIISTYSKSLPPESRDHMLEYIFSHKELSLCRQLLTNKSLFKHIQSQTDFLSQEDRLSFDHLSQANIESSEQNKVQGQDLLDFKKLVTAIHGKNACAALRIILKYSLEHNCRLTNSSNAVSLYRLFESLMEFEGPFKETSKERQPWDYYCGSGRQDILALCGGSVAVVIAAFELALFNKNVQKSVKSSTLMDQRNILFDFININATYIHRLFDQAISEGQSSEKIQKVRIRLVYSMMYCAFEIRNDMMLSVNLYQQLQQFTPAMREFQTPIHLSWISQDYILDSVKMAEFGDFKIKQAKVFKDYDSGLLKLKQKEHQLNEERHKAKAAGQEPPPKIKESEFDRYANFYLDQFFISLNASVTVDDKAPDSCVQMQNEEKVKEMWSQLTYPLCRSTTQLMLKALQSLFCVFTTISYLNKSFYEQFILKKLDFEKLLSSLHGRLRKVFRELCKQLETMGVVSVCQLKEVVLGKVKDLFGLGDKDLEANGEAAIVRLLITLLRSITPEFLHYNVFLTQSSNSAFASMLQSELDKGKPASMSTDKHVSLQQILAISGRQSGQIINIYPQLFLYLEFMKSVITSSPSKNNATNLKSVTRLLIHFDKLAHLNPEKREVFVKTYCQLVVVALPVLLKCCKLDLARAQVQHDQWSQIEFTHENGLLQFVNQAFKFFFDMKFTLESSDEVKDIPLEYLEEEEATDWDDNPDEEDTYFRRLVHLSSLLFMLKREKSAKNAVGNPVKSQILKYFESNIDINCSFLSDAIFVLGNLSNDKIWKHGELTAKDVKNMQSFNELAIDFINKNQADISEEFNSEAGNALSQLLKDAKTGPLAENLLSEKEKFSIGQEGKIESCSNVQNVLNYVINVLSHTVLTFAPYQISRFDQSVKLSSAPSGGQQSQNLVGSQNNFYFQFKKSSNVSNSHLQIAKMHESLFTLISSNDAQPSGSPLNLQSGLQQFSKVTNQAMRNISKLLKTSLKLQPHEPNSDEASLMSNLFNVSYLHSVLHLQQYATACNALLYCDSKSGQDKSKSEKRHQYLQHSINCVLLAYRCLVQSEQIQGVWSDKTRFQLAQMVIDQMLAIVMVRLKVVKLKQKLKAAAGQTVKKDKEERVRAKIQALKTISYLLANIADQIDVYACPSNDPRVNMKVQSQNATADLLNLLFAALQDEAKAENNKTAQRQFMSLAKAEDCLQKVAEIADKYHFDSKKNDLRLNLNFVYSLIQAKYQSSLATRFSLSLSQKFMGFRRSLEICQVNKNINGILECFRKMIKGSLELAVAIKYRKGDLGQRVGEYQQVIQSIVKPILQDKDLKNFIVKQLGQSDSGENEQGLEKTGAQQQQLPQSKFAFDDSVIKLDHNAQSVREKIFQADDDDLLMSDPATLRDENDLAQIYKMADQIHNSLNSSSKMWIKAKFQLICAKSILSEMQGQENPKEKFKLVLEMLKPMNTQLQSYEDFWNGVIYEFSEQKNLVTSVAHQELTGLTQLRLKYTQFVVEMAEKAQDYESIKDVFTKKKVLYKQGAPDDSSSGKDLLHEVQILFDLCKDKYLKVFCANVASLLEKYKRVRGVVIQSVDPKDDNKWKVSSAKQAQEQFEAMRKEFQPTKVQIPNVLQEAFTLYVETHSKKSFFVTRKLISDEQKADLMQAVINCCAVCGPDNFNLQEDKKGKSGNKGKFLDYAKITSPEGQMESLVHCISWYLEILDKQAQGKFKDFHKKLKTVLEEVKQRQAAMKQDGHTNMILD